MSPVGVARASEQSSTTAESLLDGGHVENDDKTNQPGLRQPLLYCKFVTKRPNLSFALMLGVHVLMILVSAGLMISGYSLFPVDFSTLPLNLDDSPWLKRDLAWRGRSEYENRISRSPHSVKSWPRSQRLRKSLDLLYDAGSDNIFTKDRLRAIQRIEESLVNVESYSDYCQLDAEYNCVPPLSVLRLFDGSLAFLDPVFNDPEFENIEKVVYAAYTMNSTRGVFIYSLGKDHTISPTYVHVTRCRSIIPLGYPMKGKNYFETTDEDLRFMTEELQPMLDDFSNTQEFTFLYYNENLMIQDAKRQGFEDMKLAIGSLIFIFGFILVHTRSMWVTCLAVFSIMCSFVETNLIYRVVLGYNYFGFFHVLAMFIILGIGADDLFVFWDAWKTSELQYFPSLALRLDETYRKSILSMFVTSLTTMLAFAASAISPLLATNSFGVFSAILVVIDYLSVVLFFPTIIIFYHVHFENAKCPHCISRCFKHAKNRRVTDTNGASANFFAGDVISVGNRQQPGDNSDFQSNIYVAHTRMSVQHSQITDENVQEISPHNHSQIAGQTHPELLSENYTQNANEIYQELFAQNHSQNTSEIHQVSAQDRLQNTSETFQVCAQNTVQLHDEACSNGSNTQTNIIAVKNHEGSEEKDEASSVSGCGDSSNQELCMSGLEQETIQEDQPIWESEQASAIMCNNKTSGGRSTQYFEHEPTHATTEQASFTHSRVQQTGDFIEENVAQSKHWWLVKFFSNHYYRIATHKKFRWVLILTLLAVVTFLAVSASRLEPDNKQVGLFKECHHHSRAFRLMSQGFMNNDMDSSIQIFLVWGLKERDLSSCHFSDYRCKGHEVFDDSFNPSTVAAQQSLLNLCDTLCNMTTQQAEELKVRRDLVTGKLKIECFATALNNFLKNDSISTIADFSLPWNRTSMTRFMTSLSSFYNVSHFNASYGHYLDVPVTYWMSNRFRQTDTTDYKNYNSMLEEQATAFTTPALSVPTVLVGNRLKYIAISVTSTLYYETLSYVDHIPVVLKWEAFMESQLNTMPKEMKGGFHVTEVAWHWLFVQKSLVDNAVMGIILGVSLALPILVVATGNIINGILATLTICCVTVCVIGVVPLAGWKLGVLVSLNMCLVVGLAVDYVVHLAEGYHMSHASDRKMRVKHALERMGLSVFSGACTTLGASAFMLFAQIQFFYQFGIFMFCTIGFSLLFSMGLYIPIMAIIGPEKNVGDLMVPVRACMKRFGCKKSSRNPKFRERRSRQNSLELLLDTDDDDVMLI